MADFSDNSKRKIVQATRLVLGRGESGTTRPRAFQPRGTSATLDKPQYRGQMPWSQADNMWAWGLGPVAHVAIVPNDDEG